MFSPSEIAKPFIAISYTFYIDIIPSFKLIFYTIDSPSLSITILFISISIFLFNGH